VRGGERRSLPLGVVKAAICDGVRVGEVIAEDELVNDATLEVDLLYSEEDSNEREVDDSLEYEEG
jgi:hypothetical protein